MKDGNEPKDADAARKPQQQTGEEFGDIKHRQRDAANLRRRVDTPRGSEPETRGASGRRG